MTGAHHHDHDSAMAEREEEAAGDRELTHVDEAPGGVINSTSVQAQNIHAVSAVLCAG